MRGHEAMRAGAATIYGHVFENPRVGLVRNLFWNLFIDLDQSGEDGDGAIQSISCDWLTFAAHRWSDLDGVSLSDCRQPALIECSIYRDSEHHWAHLDSFSIRSGAAVDRSNVTLTLHLPPESNSETAADRLDVECEVRFEGIIVVPGNFTSPPATPADAAILVAEFADLGALRPPIWDRFRYVFESTD